MTSRRSIRQKPFLRRRWRTSLRWQYRRRREMGQSGEYETGDGQNLREAARLAARGTGQRLKGVRFEKVTLHNMWRLELRRDSCRSGGNSACKPKPISLMLSAELAQLPAEPGTILTRHGRKAAAASLGLAQSTIQILEITQRCPSEGSGPTGKLSPAEDALKRRVT